MIKLVDQKDEDAARGYYSYGNYSIDDKKLIEIFGHSYYPYLLEYGYPELEPANVFIRYKTEDGVTGAEEGPITSFLHNVVMFYERPDGTTYNRTFIEQKSSSGHNIVDDGLKETVKAKIKDEFSLPTRFTERSYESPEKGDKEVKCLIEYS